MVRELSWDTEFFGFKVGVFHSFKNSLPDKEYCLSRGFDIVYIYSENPLKVDSVHHEVKVLFSKIVSDNYVKDDNINLLTNTNYDLSDIEKVVFQSGHQSRFLLDKFFGEGNFRKLYRAWIEKNIKSPKDFVLVYKKESDIAGFVSYSLNNGLAKIELIAVSERFRGLGIGKKLLNTVESFLEQGSELQVPTQESNHVAMSFYKNYGFKILEKKHIYHYVPNPL